MQILSVQAVVVSGIVYVIRNGLQWKDAASYLTMPSRVTSRTRSAWRRKPSFK
jgi:hypothetical protein